MQWMGKVGRAGVGMKRARKKGPGVMKERGCLNEMKRVARKKGRVS